jgi:hypothetical protein
MKMLVVIALGSAPLIFAGCTTLEAARVVRSNGKTHIVELRTGPKGESAPKNYERLKKAAAQACSSEFRVLERTHQPAAFACAKDVLDPAKFYWVIECI